MMSPEAIVMMDTNMRYVSGDIQMEESKVSHIVVHLYMYVAGDISHNVESLEYEVAQFFLGSPHPRIYILHENLFLKI